jgi:hypothetical protein
MIVGYSQGGLDAQNIAAYAEANPGYIHGDITTVITFASPINHDTSTQTRYHIVYLEDRNDFVPLMPTSADIWAVYLGDVPICNLGLHCLTVEDYDDYRNDAVRVGQLFSRDSGVTTTGWDLHDDVTTYETVGHYFDTYIPESGNNYDIPVANVQADMVRFRGTVIP